MFDWEPESGGNENIRAAEEIREDLGFVTGRCPEDTCPCEESCFFFAKGKEEQPKGCSLKEHGEVPEKGACGEFIPDPDKDTRDPEVLTRLARRHLGLSVDEQQAA